MSYDESEGLVPFIGRKKVSDNLVARPMTSTTNVPCVPTEDALKYGECIGKRTAITYGTAGLVVGLGAWGIKELFFGKKKSKSRK